MDIGSINTYNTTFSAQYRGGKYAKKPSHNKAGAHAYKRHNNTGKKIATIGGTALVTSAAVLALFSPKNTQQNSALAESTYPTYSYSESYTPEETTIVTEEATYPNYKMTTNITTTPIEQREPKWHTVVVGDRLADIVKEYAEIDRNTPDEELVPYYEILEQDNPGKWSNRDIIKLGSSIRVDGILPEYTTRNYVNTPDTQGIDPTEPTFPEDPTIDKDAIYIGDMVFYFDKETVDKKPFEKYVGLLDGKLTIINGKMNGSVEQTIYFGETEDSGCEEITTFDKYGKKEKVISYNSTSGVTETSYEYGPETTKETEKDLSASFNHIKNIITIKDIHDGSIIERSFCLSSTNEDKCVAKFNFEQGKATIGERELVFDIGTFNCDDSQIGSKRYSAQAFDEEVRIDVLKNGFCIEFLDENGNIKTREQYDTKGKLIEVEHMIK